MKKLLHIFYIILGIFVLASCDPDQDFNGDYLIGVHYTPTSTGTAVTKQLKQMTSHLKNDAGQFEDQSITYSYSGSKLLSFKDNSGAVYTLSYNNANKISKIYSALQTSDFEYSGTDLYKTITTISGAGKITSTYSFSAGKLSKVISVQELSIPIPLKYYYETTFEFQGENMTNSLTKNGVYNPLSGNLEMSADTQSVSFTYDSKSSPYRLLPMEYNLFLVGIASQAGNFVSANNAEKVTVSKTGSAPQILTFVHTYDTENYPTKSTAGDQHIAFQY
ncbi:MAG: hypothetical protein L6262_08100 [Weeksellaceae bacterium]|nr:hypothetical protein [Weeksellaceae bacterium]